MKRILEGLSIVGVAAILGTATPALASSTEWTSDFGIEKADLASTGSNPYFILQPGYQLTLENGKDTLTITVLDETKTIDGVETRVVEERETKNGKPKEISRNYFAISKANNCVFYFGEDTTDYDAKGGPVQGGSWHAGENGAKPGMFMPSVALLGARHYQEFAPKEAMDRAEIVSVSETVVVPAGKFEHVLKTKETTPLEPKVKESKLYARGVGLVTDEGFKLAKYGFIKK